MSFWQSGSLKVFELFGVLLIGYFLWGMIKPFLPRGKDEYCSWEEEFQANVCRNNKQRKNQK